MIDELLFSSPVLTLLLVTTLLLAGFVQGIAGFGSGLIAIPVFVLFVDPRVLIPAALVQGLLMNGALAFGARAHIQPRRIGPILAGAVVGLPFGTALLLALSADLLKIAIGAATVTFGLLLISGRRLRAMQGWWLGIPVGALSGLLNGSISLSGPPVILFFANQGAMKDNFRANLVTYFLGLNIITLALFGVLGLMTREVLLLAAWTLPPALAGVYLGARASKRVKETTFKKLALLLVTSAGAISMISGLVTVLKGLVI